MTSFIGFSELCNKLSKLKGKKVLLTFHSVGDRDAVASALALSSSLPNSIVITPDFITNNARRMLSKLHYEKRVKSEKEIKEETEAIIITDANNLEALGKFAEKLMECNCEIIFIDHHAARESKLGGNAYIFNSEGYNSASGIVYDALKENGEGISKETASLLLNGIISDSAGFQNSNPLTFKQIGELLAISRMTYSEVSESFHHDISADNREKMIDDLFRAERERLGEYIIMYGKSESSPSFVAETAITLGADASVFWSVRKSEATISARMRSPLDAKLSIHLGKLMYESGKVLNGTGGGHPCAAGAYGPKKENIEKASWRILDSLRSRMSVK